MGKASIALFLTGAAALTSAAAWVFPPAGLFVFGALALVGGWLFMDDGRST